MAKEIFIKYNPYRLQTEVTIDGSPVKQNSKFNVGEKRLQEWIDKLPEYVREEFNTRDVEIVFYGTKLDYEDLKEIADDAGFKTRYMPAKDGVANKEAAIQSVFEKIQKGPFDELRSPKLIRAFEKAKNNEFEVNVVATMSSGKSTLINSFMKRKLMPAANKACTATITRINDNDRNNYSAKAYDDNGVEMDKVTSLSYEKMEDWNKSENVSMIDIDGDIPFVDSDEMRLVLVDTPGTNNSNDHSHKVKTYQTLSAASMPVILYILNATQFGTNDDKTLLSDVAEEMNKKGKQSRDRFIFVMNKIDQFDDEDDSVEEILKESREYLSSFGITNPNVYPASARTALEARTVLTNYIDEDDVWEEIGRVRKLNKSQQLHLEKYAPLPKNAKLDISNQLNDKGNLKDVGNALIHSGIPSIEEAIRIYVDKYSKTARVKALVDAFEGHLKSSEVLVKIEESIQSSIDDKEDARNGIETIKRNLSDGDRVKEFKEKIESINIDDELELRRKKVFAKVQSEITTVVDKIGKKEMTVEEAEKAGKEFFEKTSDLQAKFQKDLQNLIDETVKETETNLKNEYLKRLGSIESEKLRKNINLDLKTLVGAELNINVAELVSGVTDTREVVVGEKWVKNTDKKWYKPWTWGQAKGYYVDEYGTEEYVNKQAFMNKFTSELEINMRGNSIKALEIGKENIKDLKLKFEDRFNELDKLLEEKMSEFNKLLAKEENTEEKIKELTEKKLWIENINNELDKILDI